MDCVLDGIGIVRSEKGVVMERKLSFDVTSFSTNKKKIEKM